MNFTSEENATQKAQEEVLMILNDKGYLNPDKFDKLHQSYRKKVEQLESQIAFNIKTQIESINTTKNFVDDCYKSVEKCEVEVESLNDLYEQESRFYEECEKFEQLSIYRKNVSVILDQLKYFFNVRSQIEKMEAFFREGPEQYEHINYKLLTLTDIRDNVVEALKKDSKTTSREMQVIIKEFQTLTEFETKFYDTVFSQFEMTLFLSLKNPSLLIVLLRITETGDKIMKSRNREGTFKPRCIASIERGIDKKFEEKLKGQNEVIMVLEHTKFAVSDLILVLDHTTKCFPKHYQIFEIFEAKYRHNVESRVMPFLENEEEVKKSYGTLIALLNWVDSYEELLSRVGLKDDYYVKIRSKVKYYMPFFLDHIQGLIVEYGEKAILKDKEEQQTPTNIEKLIKNKQELVTNFPEDIFHFINAQIDILGPKMKGELYIELLRCVCSSISEILTKEVKNLLSTIPVTEEEGQRVSPLFFVTLYVNNFYRCLTYANETRQYSTQHIKSEDDLERIERIFSSELHVAFNESITKLLEHMVKIISYDVSMKLVPTLFLPSWVNEDPMTPIVATLKDFLDDISYLMINQIYFNKLTKMVFKNLVNAYIEQLILTVRYVQPTIAKNFFPKCLTDLSLMMENKDKKKKEKEKKLGIANTLQNRGLIVPQFQHDCGKIVETIEEYYLQSFGKTSLDELIQKFDLLVGLLEKSKIEIEGMLSSLIQIYDKYSIYLLEVALWMREDCDAQFKQQRTEQLAGLLNKQQIQN